MVTNNADVGREAVFDVMLPVEAIITNLTMRIDNRTIVGKVEEKEKAKKIYDKVQPILNSVLCCISDNCHPPTRYF